MTAPQYVFQSEIADNSPASGLRKLIKMGISVLTILLVLQSLFEFLVVPQMKITRVILEGDVALSDEELFEITGIRKNDFYYHVNSKELEELLLNVPRIREAKVERVFPDALRLILVGRRPLIMALVKEDNRTIPLVCDSEGVVFQVGGEVTHFDLPVLSGLNAGAVVSGLQLPLIVLPLLKQLQELKTSSPGLFAMISEIALEKTSEYSFDIVLFPAQLPVKIRMGPELSELALKQVAVVLDMLKRDDLFVQMNELDFRTDKVVLSSGLR